MKLEVLKQIFDEDKSFFLDVTDIVKRSQDSETDIPIFPNYHNNLYLTPLCNHGIVNKNSMGGRNQCG